MTFVITFGCYFVSKLSAITLLYCFLYTEYKLYTYFMEIVDT